MQSTLLSFTLAISFFTCYALADDDNLQLLTEPASFLSPSSPDDNRPPDPSLDYQKSFPNLIDNNNSNDGGNLPPTTFDHQTWIAPSVGDVSLVEAQAASASASGAEDPDTQMLWGGDGSGGGGAAGCHMNEKVKRGEEEDQTKNVPALLMCPLLLPGQKTAPAPAPSPAPPADGAAAAAAAEKKKEKGPVRIDDDNKNMEMIDGPPLSSVGNKFDWDEEICPPDVYGALRQVPVCHSGNELLERFDSKLGSWILLDIRPCRFFFSFSFFSEKNKSSSWGNMVL